MKKSVSFYLLAFALILFVSVSTAGIFVSKIQFWIPIIGYTVTVLLVFLAFLFHKIDRQKALLKIKEAELREIERQNDLKKMLRTDYLVKAQNKRDSIISIVPTKNLDLFLRWGSKKEFPGVDPAFELALKEEPKRIASSVARKVIYRRFFPKHTVTENKSISEYFYSFRKSYTLISCTALETICHLNENKELLERETIYLWDTTPEREYNKLVKAAIITRHPDNNEKFFLCIKEIKNVDTTPNPERDGLQIVIKIPNAYLPNTVVCTI